MAICKRLNPNVEVPEVVDLIQQIDEMLQCDKTEKTVTIDDNGTLSVSIDHSVVLLGNMRINMDFYLKYCAYLDNFTLFCIRS
jgi:hypothetical protein